MSVRKLIKFGPSSYGISIPLDWIEKHKIDDTNSLYFKDNDSYISYYLEDPKKNLKKEAIIDFDSLSLKLFNKLLVSYYLRNFPSIIIKGESIDERFEQIKTYVDKLPRLEVTTIKSNSLMLHNATDFQNINIDELIINIENSVISMLETLKEKDFKRSYSKIQMLDTSINQMYFLGTKILNYSIEVEQNYNVIKNIIYYTKIINLTEKIGDNIKRISRYYKLHLTNPEILKDINPTIELLIEYQNLITNFKIKKNGAQNEILNSLQDKKNSILKDVEEKNNLREENYQLELVISHIIKDILGLYDEIIVITIDTFINNT